MKIKTTTEINYIIDYYYGWPEYVKKVKTIYSGNEFETNIEIKEHVMEFVK